jgi:hypothetical protein
MNGGAVGLLFIPDIPNANVIVYYIRIEVWSNHAPNMRISSSSFCAANAPFFLDHGQYAARHSTRVYLE